MVFADLTERTWVEAAVLQAGQMEQRLACIKLSVREAAHRVNNDLALAAIGTAVQHLRKFQRVIRVETHESRSASHWMSSAPSDRPGT